MRGRALSLFVTRLELLAVRTVGQIRANLWPTTSLASRSRLFSNSRPFYKTENRPAKKGLGK